MGLAIAKHILIVDDEPNVRLVFRTALESTGAELAAAEDGDTARSRASGLGLSAGNCSSRPFRQGHEQHREARRPAVG